MNLSQTTASVLLTIGLAASCSCGEQPPATKPANVILITMDTTRADYLSSYGYHRETTPHMDALANEGITFTRAMSTSAVTPVSHASILTGLYQQEHGVRVIVGDAGTLLPADTQSFATVLKRAGYQLAAVHSAFPVSNFYGFNQGFDLFESLEGEISIREIPKFDSDGKPLRDPATGEILMNEVHGWDVANATRRSEVSTDLALQFLDTATEPFFLWIHYWDPHDANDGPPLEFLDKKYIRRDPRGNFVRSDEFYAEEVRFVDSQLGRLFAGLLERNLYDDSLIVLTADHGEGLSDGEAKHGWKAHRELYVEQLNVPLICKFPKGADGVEPGTRIDRLVGTIDLFPTVCDYLDLALPQRVNGESLRGLIEGAQPPSRLRYADQINGFDKNALMTDNRPKARFIYAVMNDDWKLIYRPTETNPKELYHISSDPREDSDVAEANPKIVDEMMIELARTAGWVTEPFRASDGVSTQVDIGSIGYGESTGEYAGRFEWVCPIRHDYRSKQRETCPECGHQLVPVATDSAD